MGRTEIIISVFLMMLSVVFYALSFEFPGHTLAFSPKIFPRFVGICLFIISAVLAIQGIAAMRRHPRDKTPETPTKKGLKKAFLAKLSAGILIGYAYTRLLSIVGYVLATPLFIAGIMLVFGEKRWLKILATSVVTTTLLYVLFRIAFRVPLPRFNLF